MLGAELSAAALQDPVLDSQYQFYGISFTLYGVLFFLCATDLTKYKPVLICVLWAFFAGLARLVSIAAVGWPSEPVIALLVSEIALPPLLLWWLTRIRDDV